jgi:hypothetical protein
MKYFELFGATGFHSTFATTFCVDFPAYEGVALARLREAGSTNNVLLADERMLAQAMSDETALPQHAGRRYSLLGSRADGVYHPKLVLQLGKSEARLVVASANLTASGMGGNLEVMGQLRASEAEPAFAPVLRHALAYLAPQLLSNAAASRQLDWALARTRWLERVRPNETVSTADGRRVGLLLNGPDASIGGKFRALVGRSRVRRVIVTSPYWDDELSAIQRLASDFRAPEVCLLINPGTRLFPVRHLPKGDRWRLFDLAAAGEWAKGRFAHAKVIIVQTEDADHVLYGSANCTEAALGMSSGVATNAEASIYAELRAGAAVAQLEFAAALTEAARILPSDMPSFDPGEKIPLRELSEHLPGEFVLSGRTLTWNAPAALRKEALTLEFYGRDGKQLGLNANFSGESGAHRFYALDGDIEPNFVRVGGASFRSSLGVVLVLHEIARNQRSAASKPVRDALEYFDDEDACEGTWILDVIQTLSRHERPVTADRRGRTLTEARSAETKTLSYQDFIRGREQALPHRTGASSLASSHMDSVRAFLNFLIGTGAKASLESSESPTDAPNFGLGDETNDAEDAIEGGDELNGRSGAVSLNEEAKRLEKLRRHQQYVKDTQAAVVEAASTFLARTRERAESEPLTAVDVLRLRALLMVVLASGSSKPQLLQADLKKMGLRRQVLPSRGEASWQLLVGRLLFSFFRRHDGGAAPLVSLLELEQQEDGSLPLDLLEAWATCLWGACALLVASDDKGQAIPPTVHQLALAPDVYTSLGLPDNVLSSKEVKDLLDGLTARYGERLGVAGPKVQELHQLRGRAPVNPPQPGKR